MNHFDRIINPSTVLWLLQMLSKKSKDYENRKICSICSLTLLSIVDNNVVACGFHEQAIIHLFNKVLQNIEVFTETSFKTSHYKYRGTSSDNASVENFSNIRFGQVPEKPAYNVKISRHVSKSKIDEPSNDFQSSSSSVESNTSMDLSENFSQDDPVLDEQNFSMRDETSSVSNSS